MSRTLLIVGAGVLVFLLLQKRNAPVVAVTPSNPYNYGGYPPPAAQPPVNNTAKDVSMVVSTVGNAVANLYNTFNPPTQYSDTGE